jgi:hypothetical protein
MYSQSTGNRQPGTTWFTFVHLSLAIVVECSLVATASGCSAAECEFALLGNLSKIYTFLKSLKYFFFLYFATRNVSHNVQRLLISGHARNEIIVGLIEDDFHMQSIFFFSKLYR